MRELICAAVAVASALGATQARAQAPAPQGPVNSLDAVKVLGDADTPNWQKLRQQEARIKPIGAEPETVTLETMTSQHTSVVNRDELDRVSAMNTLDVLERVPGITPSRTGALDGTIVLRGMDSSGFRVPMFINGDRFRGRPAFQFMMVGPAELERVEVIRGPASIRYGSDGLSGMVNFVTRRPKGTFDREFGLQGGEIELGYRSNGNGKQGSLSVEAGGNHFDFLGYVSGRQSQNYDTPEGEIFNSHYKTASAGLVLGYMPDNRQRYEFSYRYGEIRDGTSNATANENNISRRAPLTIHQLRLGYEGTFDHSLLQRLDASLYMNLFESKLETITLSNGGNTERRQVNNVRGPNIIGGHVTAETQRNAYGLKLTTGADFAYDHWLGNKTHIQVTNLTTGAMTDNGNPRNGREMKQTNAGAFVLADWEIRKGWNLNFGGRYDHYLTDTEIAFLPTPDLQPLFEAARNSRTSAWTGSVGTSYFVNDVIELTASYGNGFRMPWHSQMFSSGWDGATYTIPNPELKPEYSVTSEVGMRLHMDNAFIDVSAFDARYRNFLETAQSTYLGMPASQTQNVGRARIKGLEVAARWQINPQWNLHGHAAYVHGVNRNTGVPLAGLAPWSGAVGVQYVGAGNAWALSGEMQFAKGQNRWDPRSEYRTAGYGVVNLYAQLQLDKLGLPQMKNSQVVLSVTNLFDKSYRSASTPSLMSRPMSELNPLVSPGRSINLTWRTRL